MYINSCRLHSASVQREYCTMAEPLWEMEARVCVCEVQWRGSRALWHKHTCAHAHTRTCKHAHTVYSHPPPWFALSSLSHKAKLHCVCGSNVTTKQEPARSVQVECQFLAMYGMSAHDVELKPSLSDTENPKYDGYTYFCSGFVAGRTGKCDHVP